MEFASNKIDLNGWAAADADYPRKQFSRRSWTNLNGEWDFCFDDALEMRHPKDVKAWTHKIQVPFAPECVMSGIGDQGFHKGCWYRREFDLEPSDSRRLIHFGAVDYKCFVWVNDRFVGSHKGGHSSFHFEITDAVRGQAKHTVTVRVIDDPHDLAKPRGKQDWQAKPHSIWYPRTTGIWQTVWLEDVPSTYIDRIRWTPHMDRWEIGFEAFLKGGVPEDYELQVCLRAGDQILARDRYEVVQGEIHRRVALSDPGIDDYRNELLWSPEKPTLIDAEIKLVKGGKIVDEVKSYTALRGIGLERGRFLLNNRPYFLRLVLDQGYWPESFMTPPSDEAIVRDIELIKAAGFNGVRKHQKIEDPRFLYWADVMGLLVWEEMPSAYRFTHESVERLVREWTEVIDRDMNHPCIITWVPFNESWGVPDLTQKAAHRSCVQALYHLTKTLDPSRPCVGNDGWEAVATDIVGIHDYDDDPVRLLERYGDDGKLEEILTRARPGGRLLTLEGYPHQGQPIMLTEFGGIAHRDIRFHAEFETWGYSTSRNSQDLEKKYSGLLDGVNQAAVLSGFCYTQFTDTFQEANGLFFADRTPKFPLEKMKRATQGRKRTVNAVDGFLPQADKEEADFGS